MLGCFRIAQRVCVFLQPVNIVAGAFFIVGAAILAGAVDVAMLVVGRVLLGVGVGLCSLVSFCLNFAQVSRSVPMMLQNAAYASLINEQFCVATWSPNSIGLIKLLPWAT